MRNGQQLSMINMFLFLGKMELLYAQEIHYTLVQKAVILVHFGNYRALVQFNGNNSIAKINIEWG